MALKQSIFDIGGELDQIAQAFDQLAEGGEEQAVLDAIEQYFADLLDRRDEKLDSYARLIRAFDFTADARQQEADRLAALAKTDKNNAKRLKDRLKLYLESAGITKIETGYNKFAIQPNGGKPPMEVDEANVPSEFCKQVPDNEKIRVALDAGQSLPFASFGERGTHLRIR